MTAERAAQAALFFCRGDINNIYDESNALIREKKTDVKKLRHCRNNDDSLLKYLLLNFQGA